jgi:ketosteroid isomerase-like protein
MAGSADVVRQVYEEWARGNFTASLEVYDEAVLYVPPANGPAGGRYLGRDAFRDFSRDFISTWKHLTCTAEELTEVDNSVVVASRWRGEAEVSGAVTDLLDFTVWTFRGPKVIRIEQFPTREDALRAVGLPSDVEPGQR